MMMQRRKATFSDSWHLVRDVKACLRAGVQVERQRFRGRIWYLLTDPFRNEFFRVSQEAYAFVGRLRKDRTIDDTWRACMEANPEESPGQEETIDLLSRLGQANLLQSNLPADAEKILRVKEQKRERMWKAQFINFLFVKIPLGSLVVGFSARCSVSAQSGGGSYLVSRSFICRWYSGAGLVDFGEPRAGRLVSWELAMVVCGFCGP